MKKKHIDIKKKNEVIFISILISFSGMKQGKETLDN